MDQAQINSECKVKITSVAELNKWAVFKSRHQLTNPIDFTGFRMPSEGTTASQDEKKALNKAVDSLVSLGLLKNLSLTEQDKTTINLSPACRRMIIKYATNQSISFSDVLNAYAEASLITQKILKCPNFRVQLPTDDELNSLESKLSDDQNQKTKRTPNLTPILQGTFIPFYLPSTKKDTLSIKKVARIANLECHPTTLRLLRYAANPSNLAECELQNKNPVAELEKFAETVPEHSLKSMPTSTKTEAKTSGLPNSKKYNASIHQGLSDAVILLTRFDEMHRVCNQLGSQAEELEWKIDPQKTELKDLQDAQEAKQTQYEKDRSKWEGELAAAENELSRYAGNEVIGTPEGGSYRRALHHPTDLDSMKTTIIAQNKRVWVGEVGENCSEGFEVYAKYELLKGMEPQRPEPVSTTEIAQSIATKQTDLDSIREQQKKMLDDFVTQYHAIKKQLKDIPSTELKQFLDKLDRCMQRLKPVAEQIPENKRPELVKKLFFKTEVAKQGRLSRWIESLRSAPPPIYASNLLKEANELHTKWLKKTQFIGVTETGSLTKIVYANGGLNTHLFRYPLACSIPSGVNFAETCSNLTSLERTIDRLNASIQSEENEIASLEVSITSISKKFITAAKDNAKTDAQNVKADILSYFGISDEDAKFITTDDNKTHSVRDIYEAFKLRATVSRYQEWPLLFKAMYVLEESKSTNDTWDVNTLALATLEAFPSRSIADMTDALVAESRAETSVAILFYKGIANQADRETLEIAKLPNVAIQESTNVARQDQPDSPTQAQEDMKKVLEEYFPTDKSEERGKLHHLNRKTTAELHAVKAKLESGRKYVRLGSKEFKQYVELMGKLDMQIAKSDCLLEYYVVSGNRSTESGGILKSLESIAGKHQTAAQPNSLDDLCADHLKIVLESYKNLFEKVGGLDTEATYDELLLIQSELTRMETIILKKYRHVTENNLKSDTFQQMQSAKQVVNARIELVKLNEEQQLTVNRLFEQYPKAESNMVQDGLNFIGNAFWQDSPPPPLPKIGGPKVSDSQSTGAFNTGETQSSDSSSGLLWFGSIWGGISTALGQYTGQHNMAKWQDSTIKSGELAKELDTYMTRYSDRVTLSQILDALVELKIDKTSLSLEKSKAEHSAVEENLKLFYHLKGKNSSITYAAVKAMPKVKPKASYQVDSTKIPTQSATQTSESATDAVSKLTPPSQELKTMTQFALEYVEAWKGSINGRQWSDTESNQLIPLKNYLDSLPDTAQLQEQDPEYAKCIGRLRIQLCTTTSNRGTYSQARLEHMITQLQVQHYKDYKREVLQYLSSLARNYSEVNPTVLEKEVDAQWEVYKDLVKTNSWTGKSKSEEDFKEEYRNFITNSSAQIDAFVKKEEKKTINTIDDSKLFEEGLNKFLGRALLLEPVPGQDQGATRRANQYDYERDGTTARIMRHLRNDHREFIGSVFEAEHGKSIRSRFPQLNIRRLKPTPPQAGWVSRGLDFLVSHRPGQHTPGAYGSGFEPRQPERGSYPPGSTQPTGNGSRSVANNIADSQSTQGFTALLTTVLNQLKDLKSRRGRRGWSDEDYKNLKALGAHLSTEPNNVLTVHEKYLLGEIRKEIEWDGKPIYTKKIDKQAFFEDFTQLSKEFTSLTQAGLIDKKQQ